MHIPRGVVKISKQDTVKQTVYTDFDGKKLIQMEVGAAYYVEGRMKNYQSAGQTVIAQTQALRDTIQVTIALEPIQKKEAIISGVTIDGNSARAIAGSKIYIQNLTTREEVELELKAGGGFLFKGIVGDTYTILAENAGSRGSIDRFFIRSIMIRSLDHMTSLNSVLVIPGHTTLTRIW